MTRNFLEMTRIDGKGKGKLQEPETERGDIENLLLHVAIEYLVVQNYVMRRMRLSAVTKAEAIRNRPLYVSENSAQRQAQQNPQLVTSL
jgi:hypothetical protein